ncbi:MAG: PD-(D/E)XK nuclease family transposase [Treponema sp.]|nr:PD-(D/E)XK nuclease family transposase [Treponema sp.]
MGLCRELTSHHAIQIDPNAKGIIMDVYLKDENKVINVEMQISNHGDLPRRARYYQAAADIDTSSLDGELRLFYDYIKGKVAQTAFTKELDATISQMKQEKKERNMYLT